MIKSIQVSPSKLSVLNDCPTCFWYAENYKCARPRGIFPTLPGGIDRVLKIFSDKYRNGQALPEQFKELNGTFFTDTELLRKWQNWRSGLRVKIAFARTDDGTPVDVSIYGALDDLLVTKDGAYSPLDFKTKGSEPKTSGEEYYQTQLDAYAYLLEKHGYKTSGEAFLVYFWPAAVVDFNDAGIHFDFQFKTYKLTTSIPRFEATLQRAVDVLTGPKPEPNVNCEYCTYREFNHVR